MVSSPVVSSGAAGRCESGVEVGLRGDTGAVGRAAGRRESGVEVGDSDALAVLKPGRRGAADSARPGSSPDFAGVDVERVSVSLGGVEVLSEVSVAESVGRTLSVLGPSGSGKTTLLRVVAGLQRVDSGVVMLGSRVVAADGVHVSADKRGVGMVFQDWALFPHLTVAANVAFGLPRAERPKGWIRPRPASRRVGDLLEMLEIADLADRLPESLSGGQRQRVALARALAPRPSVLLLDEPFSSLDTTLSLEVRTDVAVLLRSLGITCVFVTHDQDEAFALGDEVAVMRAGTVMQQASPDVVYERPASRWVAGFVGVAVTVPGAASGGRAQTFLGRLPLLEPASGAVDVLVRPEHLSLVHGEGAIVDHFEYYGHDTVYHVLADRGVMLQCRIAGAPRFAAGAEVAVRHSGAHTVAFPAVA